MTAAAALAAGHWQTAREQFEAAFELDQTAEAMLGLGTALWWLGETTAAVRWQERAYAEFRRRPDPAQAALTAVALCQIYAASLGNLAASGGWLGRLARLVDEFDLEPVRGWLSLCRAAMANGTFHLSDAESRARETVDAARLADDIDLELCGLAEVGFALVQMGKTEEGSALLDEAMAGALGGEALRPETVVHVGCRTIASCSRTADMTRAVQWIHMGDEFTRRYGGLHLHTMSRVQYGHVLFENGRWAEAEQELRAALRVGKSAERALYAEAVASLAELRLAQGQVGEAAGLLEGFEDHPAAADVLATVHLRRGQPLVAAEILRARLDGFAEPCLESARAAELLTEAEVELGELEQATSRARALVELGKRGDGCAVILARAQRALGIVHAAGGEERMASEHLRRALAAFVGIDMPFEAARTRRLLAVAVEKQEPEVAVERARTALRVFEQLGACAEADAAAALLRTLGVRVPRGRPSHDAGLTRREREVLELLGECLSNQEMAQRLFLSRKTVEHHVGSVLTKLGLDNRAQAAAYAIRNPRQDAAGDVR